MRVFSKSEKLNNVCYDIRGPVLDKALEMERAGEKLLKLNIGNPAVFGFHVSETIQEKMRREIKNADAYSDSKGIMGAREAIAYYCKRKGMHGVGVEDVYTGNGVSELISICMQGLLNDGDEILIPSPDYPLWTAAATLSGGTVVHYMCDEKSNWYPDLKDMESKITDKTKGIVVINPNNPTGVLYSIEILEGIVDIARRHELIIFADEIYDRLVMDGLEHVSIASLAPDVPVITLNGLSKSHRAAGYRIGWMSISGKKDSIEGYVEGINMLTSMRLCSNVPGQNIIEEALNDMEIDSELLPGGRIYEQRKCVYERVNSIPGLSAVRPQAAFYIFPKLDIKRFNITDDERFVLDFLREKKVLLVAGKGFNWGMPDHFRIVSLPEVGVLSSAMDRLEEFLSGYRQN